MSLVLLTVNPLELPNGVRGEIIFNIFMMNKYMHILRNDIAKFRCATKPYKFIIESTWKESHKRDNESIGDYMRRVKCGQFNDDSKREKWIKNLEGKSYYQLT